MLCYVVKNLILFFRKKVSSGVDAKEGKLVLFLPKTADTPLKISLEAQLASFSDTLKNAYTCKLIYEPIEIKEENGDGKIRTGCKIRYYDNKHEEHYATCGAFLKNQEKRIFLLSSCHSHSPAKCVFITSTSSSKQLPTCEYIDNIYKMNPLMDAVLMEIGKANNTDEEIDVFLRSPFPNSVLCGPFDKDLEDLQLTVSSTSKREVPMVMKHGSTSQKTKGILSLYEFEHPATGLTGGLVIIPASEEEMFSEPGDSGSVIYLMEKHKGHPESKSKTCHLALAMLCHGVTGLTPRVKCTLAFRLDEVIEHFESTNEMKLFLEVQDHMHK